MVSLTGGNPVNSTVRLFQYLEAITSKELLAVFCYPLGVI